jgi:hypothetical protein
VPSERIARPCEGSRYCSFTAALYSEHLAVFEPAPQAVVGGCWFESFEYPDEPARFVCNRCAHRTLAYDGRWGPEGRLWLLLCPFCGEALGQPGAAMLLFDAQGKVIKELELPTRDALDAVVGREGARP